jgi:hypothetical protein
MTVYTVEKRLQHLQATSLMLDYDDDDVNFPVTIAKSISPFGSHLNSIGVNSIGVK